MVIGLEKGVVCRMVDHKSDTGYSMLCRITEVINPARFRVQYFRVLRNKQVKSYQCEQKAHQLIACFKCPPGKPATSADPMELGSVLSLTRHLDETQRNMMLLRELRIVTRWTPDE